MRIDRLILVLLIVTSCKVSNTSMSTVKYKEDLSVHRAPVFSQVKDSVSAQEVRRETYVPLTGHIGTELDQISEIAANQNKEGRYVEGFVIQVYSGSDRDQANQLWAQMNESFPELVAKITYRQPNFRVKAGRFIDRLEANRIHQQVKDSFPQALLLPERFLLKYE